MPTAALQSTVEESRVDWWETEAGQRGVVGSRRRRPGNGAAADLDIAPRRRGRHRYMADTPAVHVVRSQGIVHGAPYTGHGRCREHGAWCAAQAVVQCTALEHGGVWRQVTTSGTMAGLGGHTCQGEPAALYLAA